MDVIDDLLLPLRAVAQLGEEITAQAEMAIAGIERARPDGNALVMPGGVNEHVAVVFDRAARLARWLPTLPVPPTSEEDRP